MIEWIRAFFKTNEIIVLFIYGQIFFTFGLAILMQTRKYSRLEIAAALPYLAIYAVTYGLAQWGLFFIPIQSTFLSPKIISALQFVQVSLLAVSFVALIHFGLHLSLNPSWRPYARWLTFILLALWEVSLVAGWLLHLADDTILLRDWEILARYVLAFPGSLLAAFGLFRQLQQFPQNESGPQAKDYIALSVIGFLCYALLGGLIVPKAGFFPASVINSEMLAAYLGAPITVFRSIPAFLLAIGIIRSLEIFRAEFEQIVADAERAKALLADRERISRELHDVTIQQIYAAGLMVEAASYQIDDAPEETRSKLAQVMNSLNNTIQEIRRYIFDLQLNVRDESMEEGLRRLLEDLRINTLLTVDLAVDGQKAHALSATQKEHILRIAREALNNVAKHAHARHVAAHLSWGIDALQLRIADDGIGVIDLPEDGQKHGLKNMRERAVLLNGNLVINARPGHGVVVSLEVPYDQNIAFYKSATPSFQLKMGDKL
jgi:signal transduction histidine kinase